MEGNAGTFFELLKIHRRKMGAGNRTRTKHPSRRVRWLYPFQYERQYAKHIKEIVKPLTEYATNQISSNLPNWIHEYHGDSRTDGFSNEFKNLLDDMNQIVVDDFTGENAARVHTMVTATGMDVSDWNNSQWQKISKPLLGIEFVVDEPWVGETINTWGETNFTLIRSLEDEYIKKVNLLVSEGVQMGTSSSEIMGQIRALDSQITGNRARLIARDQVGKLNGLMTQRRMTEAGIDTYIWLTAGDERVRDTHKKMDGTLNRWDNASVYSKDNGQSWIGRPSGMVGSIPGSGIQCRCTGIPAFDDIVEEVDNTLAREGVSTTGSAE